MNATDFESTQSQQRNALRRLRMLFSRQTDVVVGTEAKSGFTTACATRQ